MTGFTKLFSSIVTSSIWQEDNATRLIWITMLATADARGVVEASIPGLAHIARVDRDECEQAIHKLESPDPDSRTEDFEGRRIEKVEGGWRILNYAYYRERGRGHDRTEYMREYMRERRRRKQCKQESTTTNRPEPKAEAEADNTPPIVPPGGNSVGEQGSSSANGEDFERFWAEYPRKVAKKKCQGIWRRLGPSKELTEQIITAVKAQKRCEQWQKDNGKFIPYPATWLNNERWTDELAVEDQDDGYARFGTHPATEKEIQQLEELGVI